MRGVLSVAVGALLVLVVGCAKPPDQGILNAVRETVTNGVPAGESAPRIESLAVTRKKRMFWGEKVWTAEVEAHLEASQPAAPDEGKQAEGTVVKTPYRVVITRPGGEWEYQVREDRALPGKEDSGRS